MKKKCHTTRHDENLARLARLEGQVRGVRKMVEDGGYCIDIVTQLQAVQSAAASVSRLVLEKHIRTCVTDAIRSKSAKAMDGKLEELMKVLKRCQR